MPSFGFFTGRNVPHKHPQGDKRQSRSQANDTGAKKNLQHLAIQHMHDQGEQQGAGSAHHQPGYPRNDLFFFWFVHTNEFDENYSKGTIQFFFKRLFFD